MKSENLCKLMKILEKHIQKDSEINNIRWAIEDLLRKDEKHNGHTNYETWLMALVLSNEQGFYNSVLEILEDNKNKSSYDRAGLLKDWVEENFWVEDYGIIRVDCTSWTNRDFQDIDWMDVISGFSE